MVKVILPNSTPAEGSPKCVKYSATALVSPRKLENWLRCGRNKTSALKWHRQESRTDIKADGHLRKGEILQCWFDRLRVQSLISCLIALSPHKPLGESSSWMAALWYFWPTFLKPYLLLCNKTDKCFFCNFMIFGYWGNDRMVINGTTWPMQYNGVYP